MSTQTTKTTQNTNQSNDVFASIDTTQQNVKIFNDNIKSFVELNKNILQLWISVFTKKIINI